MSVVKKVSMLVRKLIEDFMDLLWLYTSKDYWASRREIREGKYIPAELAIRIARRTGKHSCDEQYRKEQLVSPVY